jgi:hypothetical protein
MITLRWTCGETIRTDERHVGRQVGPFGWRHLGTGYWLEQRK